MFDPQQSTPGEAAEDADRARTNAAGRTLPDLAETLDASKGYLSGVETGAFAPSRLPRLMAWAKALGLDPLELAIQAHGERAPREIRTEVRRRLQGPA